MRRALRLCSFAMAALALSSSLSRAAPGSAIVPGSIRVDATYQHIGALWSISGDADLDSVLSLEYRRVGDSAWRPGAPATRAYPTLIVDGAPLGLNYWAASALFLDEGQTYELRLTLSDPDGGGQTQIVTTATRIEPQPDASGRQLYVAPGSGGGDGSPGNPFKGLQAAADAAQPGDVFHIAAGSYSPFQLLASGASGHPSPSMARATAALSSTAAAPIAASSRWASTTRPSVMSSSRA